MIVSNVSSGRYAMRGIPKQASWLLGVMLLFGCAPKVLLQRPAAWPEEWARRRLYHTPQALIYVGSAAAAGEADRIAAEASREFAGKTGATPLKGVIVVTDTDDAPLLPDLRAMYELMNAIHHADDRDSAAGYWGGDVATAPATASAPATATSPATSPEASWDQQVQEMEKNGFSLPTLLKCAAWRLEPPALAAAGLPPISGEIGWAVAIPTHAACRTMAHEIMSAAMKSDEITIAQRLLIAPWRPLVESTMADEFSAERKTVLLFAHTRSQARWDAGQIARWMREFRRTTDHEREDRVRARSQEIEKGHGPAPSSGR